MTQPPNAKPYLQQIRPYVPGKSKTGKDDQPVIKLSSNENPYGPSPKAIEAYHAAESSLHRYAEGSGSQLREAIEQTHGLPAEQIICGDGSDEILGMLVHAYAGPGDEVIFTEHAFLMYHIYTLAYGATPVEVPETDLRADVDAMLDAVTEKTRLVFLANPNNPTGSYVNKYELHRLRNDLPEEVILVIDGAYAEYVTEDDYSTGHELVNTSNTVITHTFSKIYGLPALRIGWGYGPPAIIDMLHRVRSPFNVTGPAIAAATAALQDEAYTLSMRDKNNAARDALAGELRSLGLTVHPSFANFLLIAFDTDGNHSAANANEYLLSQGIIPREVGNYKLPHCLRITIGTEVENAALLAAMKAFMNG